jgi:hypothetical protein
VPRGHTTSPSAPLHAPTRARPCPHPPASPRAGAAGLGAAGLASLLLKALGGRGGGLGLGRPGVGPEAGWTVDIPLLAGGVYGVAGAASVAGLGGGWAAWLLAWWAWCGLGCAAHALPLGGDGAEGGGGSGGGGSARWARRAVAAGVWAALAVGWPAAAGVVAFAPVARPLNAALEAGGGEALRGALRALQLAESWLEGGGAAARMP